MTHQQAIDFMKQSVDIDDWNQRRDVVKQDPDCGVSFVSIMIDQRGLCPQTLKTHRPRMPRVIK